MRLAHLILPVVVLAEIAFAQDTNFSTGPQYLMNYGSPLFLQPIATPSLDLNASLPTLPELPQTGPSSTDTPYASTSSTQSNPYLFSIYYGYPLASEIELTSEPPRELPASITDVGVRLTSAEHLRELGYGIPLGDDATFWKSHKSHATRVYTNADVSHLHGS